jgi:hypothetical protein
LGTRKQKLAEVHDIAAETKQSVAKIKTQTAKSKQNKQHKSKATLLREMLQRKNQF